ARQGGPDQPGESPGHEKPPSSAAHDYIIPRSPVSSIWPLALGQVARHTSLVRVSSSPLRDLVLVGGGHGHVQVLRSWAMAPVSGVRLTVIVDRSVAVYSGMVPGLVAGQYRGGGVGVGCGPRAPR